MARAAFRIEHRIGVAAPPELIWEFLGDVAGWPAWNPLYPKAEGKLSIGGRLSLTEASPGLPPAAIAPTVVDWTPEAQILWRLSERGGLIQRLRYIEIDKLTEEACILSSGEDWSGRLAPFVGRERRRAVRAGLEAMNEALREKAAAEWIRRGGKPTSEP
jgi:hypothetical protein